MHLILLYIPFLGCVLRFLKKEEIKKEKKKKKREKRETFLNMSFHLSIIYSPAMFQAP